MDDKLVWRKGTRTAHADDCVEVATDGQSIYIRDSKDKAGPALTVDSGSWVRLLAKAQAGDLD